MPIPLIVITGPVGAGKTTVADTMQSHLAHRGLVTAFIDQDAYYKGLADLSLAERREINFDHPDAFDTELLVQHLRELRAGRPIQKPVYNFVTFTREPHTVLVEPADLILIEGILVLHIGAVRELLDVKIFVDAEDDVRIIRRLTRDIKERGRDFDGVVTQYFRTVRPMHYGFVEPSKRHADIIVPHGGNNPIAIEMLIGAIRGKLGEWRAASSA